MTRMARTTSDGHGDNRSYNYGVEGPTDDEALIDIRERQKRNLLATLLLSHGTPMLLAGDEFGRTQNGNNNAYCQDNEIGWIDWSKITDRDRALTEFTRILMRIRDENPIFPARQLQGWLRHTLAQSGWWRPDARILGR